MHYQTQALLVGRCGSFYGVRDVHSKPLGICVYMITTNIHLIKGPACIINMNTR